MDSNTYRNLAILGYGKEMIEQLDFRNILNSYINSCIVIIDDQKSSIPVGETEQAFNFFCQPVWVSIDNVEFIEKEQLDEPVIRIL